jgi:hypothetical protein
VEDLQDLEGWRGRGVQEGGDVGGFAGEGDRAELYLLDYIVREGHWGHTG